MYYINQAEEWSWNEVEDLQSACLKNHDWMLVQLINAKDCWNVDHDGQGPSRYVKIRQDTNKMKQFHKFWDSRANHQANNYWVFGIVKTHQLLVIRQLEASLNAAVDALPNASIVGGTGTPLPMRCFSFTDRWLIATFTVSDMFVAKTYLVMFSVYIFWANRIFVANRLCTYYKHIFMHIDQTISC